MADAVSKRVLEPLQGCRAWSTAATPRAVEELARQSRAEGFEAGGHLLAEGSAAKRFGVVGAGRVRIFHLSHDGKRTTYEDLGPGEPLGMVAALAGSRNPANAEAITEGYAVWVPREALLAMARSEPDVAAHLLHNLAGRVVDFTSMLQTLSLDVPARLASYLFQRSLAVGEQTEDGLSVSLGMQKSDLAAALATVPESLSRAFARLRDDGIIEVHGSTVVVHDVGALARLGSGYAEE